LTSAAWKVSCKESRCGTDCTILINDYKINVEAFSTQELSLPSRFLVLITHGFVSDGSSTIIYILYNYCLKS
jgi:hypothetical protein